jgi:hypothetical protein
MRTIAETEHFLLKYADQKIDVGSADDGFAYGYLSGHISVVAAECEVNHRLDLMDTLSQALQTHKQELTPADQALVNQAWGNLQQALESDLCEAVTHD